jgi:hypothetical protein
VAALAVVCTASDAAAEVCHACVWHGGASRGRRNTSSSRAWRCPSSSTSSSSSRPTSIASSSSSSSSRPKWGHLLHLQQHSPSWCAAVVPLLNRLYIMSALVAFYMILSRASSCIVCLHASFTVTVVTAVQTTAGLSLPSTCMPLGSSSVQHTL